MYTQFFFKYCILDNFFDVVYFIQVIHANYVCCFSLFRFDFTVP